jgi:septal ring factor EnvC (AmiA/AmiB activator)
MSSSVAYLLRLGGFGLVAVAVYLGVAAVAYSSAFTFQQERIAAMDVELRATQAEIKKLNEQLAELSAQYAAQKRQLDSLLQVNATLSQQNVQLRSGLQQAYTELQSCQQQVRSYQLSSILGFILRLLGP